MIRIISFLLLFLTSVSNSSLSSSQQLLLSFTIVFSFCFDVPLTIWQSLCLYAMELILFLTAWVTWPFWFLLFAWDLHSTFVSLFGCQFFFLIFDITLLLLYIGRLLHNIFIFLTTKCYTICDNSFVTTAILLSRILFFLISQTSEFFWSFSKFLYYLEIYCFSS